MAKRTEKAIRVTGAAEIYFLEVYSVNIDLHLAPGTGLHGARVKCVMVQHSCCLALFVNETGKMNWKFPHLINV